MEAALRVCANCRVLVHPVGTGAAGNPFLAWEHVPEFAEKFSRSVCPDPQPGRVPSGSEARFGLARIKTPGGDKLSLKGSIDGLEPSTGAPITVAVDGSYKLAVADKVSKPMSWAYLATHGLYGLGTAIVPGYVVGGNIREDGSDPQRTLQAELRAIAAALQAIGDEHPITILADSQDAIAFMTLWRDGHNVMPGGYNLARAGGRESTLGRLARRAREAGDRITMEWVRGHTGHPLNEAADTLARMARLWSVGELLRETVEAEARVTVIAALTHHAQTAVV